MSNPAVTPSATNNYVLDVGPTANVVPYDIRNGDSSLATSVYVRPTIASGYHWAPIENLDHSLAMAHMGLYIRTAFAMLSQHGMSITNPSVAQIRKAAICLGVARAVNTAYYQLKTTDFIAGELAPPVYTSTVDPNLGLQVTHETNAPAAMTAFADGMPALSNDEKNAITALLPSSLGIIPLHGYSLMMTGHHYISTTGSQSVKAFGAVEKQFWLNQTVKDWFDPDKDLIRDILWHKACHPVNITLKNTLSRDMRVIKMLNNAGVGSATARLPAMESELRAANSWTALLNTVTPLFQENKGDIFEGVFAVAVNAVHQFPIDGKPATGPLDSSIPSSVVNRDLALAYLKSVMDTNSGAMAMVFGFHEAMLENVSMAGGSSGKNSLSMSNTLRKLQDNCLSGFNAGQEYFKDYMAARNKARSTGVFKAPTITFRAP